MPNRKSRRSSRALTPLVGIGWYDPAQWSKLKKIAAEHRRVPIDVDALVAWCDARGKPVNGSARAEYTAELVRSMASQ